MDNSLIDRLFSLRRFGIKPGLERIEFLLDKIGSPHHRLSSFHIAGTNGKGSVSSIIASVLREAGYKVGLYTSPHIFSFNERIRINGKPIPNNDLEPKLVKMMEIGKEIDATFFEISTAIAFDYFYENKVDFVVLETGLGGRFDATNVIPHPVLSIITRIDFDHEQYLGQTIEEITREKAGIIKTPHTAIVGPNDFSIYSIIFDCVSQNDKILLAEFLIELVESHYSTITKFPVMVVSIQTLHNKFNKLVTTLLGDHQVENLITSLVAIETVQIPLRITNEHIYNGLVNLIQNSGLRGRIEYLQTNPSFVVDVAHNPNAIEATTKTLEQIEPNTKWNVIFSAMKDKNISAMLKSLIPIAKRFLLPNLFFDRAEKNTRIGEILNEELHKVEFGTKPEILFFDTPKEALKHSIEFYEPTLSIGSFYLLGEIAEDLKKTFNWDIELSGTNLQI